MAATPIDKKEFDFGSDNEPKVVLDSASVVSAEDRHFGTTSTAHRKFEPYHVNLIAIGGTIGTALFVYMGAGLTAGGPLALLLGYTWWTSVIFCISEGQKELCVQWPTDTAFARFAARYWDEAAGVAVGWNFWLSQVALVIFEVVAFGLVLGFWDSAQEVHPAVFISIVIVAYTALNIWNSRFFANAEFGAAVGKVLLITGLIIFTFVAMLGGNPLNDRFGFRFWRNPGPLTTPYPQHSPALGRFEGVLACVINACFTVAGPDYLSMVAGEARNPRPTMKRAFNATIYRLVIFFIGSALCIGILVPYNDSNLLRAQATAAPGGGRSPYVIAMRRLQIPVLPHIVNALILTSVFSAGNAFLFCASRSLAQMARDGQAPKFLARRNRHGVPWVAVAACLILSLLSYCQVSTTAQKVITYLTGLVGACQLVNWVVMSVTWIKWNAAMKAQGISRDTLYARSPLQPFAAWYALISSILVLFMQGYGVFLKDNWDTSTFIFAYFAPAMFVVIFIGWKIVKRTKWETALTADVTSFVDDPEFTEHIDYESMERRSKSSRITHKVLSTVF
ncbi:general amino acid permease agp2 [Microbotryomycetes sp. JL221]|nr:general amino acid permease agp2 [Microbotryomycetes sp. JL221]